MLENTKIEINARGYTFEMDINQGYCTIGLQSLKGETNLYKLGTIFLRNFYTALDYDMDLITIGVNKGSSELAKATIMGKTSNPYQKVDNDNTIVGFFIFFLFVVLDPGI